MILHFSTKGISVFNNWLLSIILIIVDCKSNDAFGSNQILHACFT